MNILGTGMSGLIGTRIKALLGGDFQFTDLSRETGYDITIESSITPVIIKSDAPWLFHLAAMTDVQGAEKERDMGQGSTSWKINVDATKKVAALAKKTGKRMLYLSTDYVFDGLKTSPYTEQDVPSPKGWYATTKYEGEKRVMEELGDRALIVRISTPYTGHQSVGKQDWVHKVIDRLTQKLPVGSPSDSLFSPTFVDDAVHAIATLVSKNEHGVWHVGAKTGISPFEAIRLLAIEYGFDPATITETTYDTFYEGKAHVPKNGVLSAEKITNFGCRLHTFEEGVKAVHAYDMALPV